MPEAGVAFKFPKGWHISDRTEEELEQSRREFNERIRRDVIAREQQLLDSLSFNDMVCESRKYL